jgi:hypothetical protein
LFLLYNTNGEVKHIDLFDCLHVRFDCLPWMSASLIRSIITLLHKEKEREGDRVRMIVVAVSEGFFSIACSVDSRIIIGPYQIRDREKDM